MLRRIPFLRSFFLLGLLVPPLAAQAPSSSSSSAPSDKGPVYVRRFSFGVKASYLVLHPIPGNESLTRNPSVPSETKGSAVQKSQPLGGGIDLQLALTNRLAVNANLLYRRVGYEASTETAVGIDNPTTPQDDRSFSTTKESTRARYYELPVTLRYFTKDRRDPGVRGIVAGGVAIRRVSNIKTSREIAGVCCDTTPVTPLHRYTMGAVAGAGVQFNDDFGIKVTPEVRYTYWVMRVFDALPVQSRPHQVEAMVSITF